MAEVTDTDRAIAQIATIFTAEMIAGYCKDARMEERAAIVAWIMDNKDEIIDWFPRDIAGAITDGEHLK